MKERCKWAFLGTASIAKKNWQAVLHSGNGYLGAVASRSRDRAQEFVDSCQEQVAFDECPVALEGYEAVLNDDSIDAVYIPLPTAIRGKWAKAALEAGKHVLIEKPCSVNGDELIDLVAVAISNNRQLMDGTMFTHSKRLASLKELVLQKKEIGDIRRVTSQFSFFEKPSWAELDIRCNANTEPFGVLGDLGWYCIRLALVIANDGLPVVAEGRAIQTYQHSDATQSVPIEFDGRLIFESGMTASFYCSFVAAHQQWANISGTEGFVSIEDFTLPYHGGKPRFEIVKSDFNMNGCNFEMRRFGEWQVFDEPSDSAVGSQESQLFFDFNQLVITGLIDHGWTYDSLKTQVVMDALLESSRIQRPIEVSNAQLA